MKIINVTYLGEYELLITFADGVEITADFRSFIFQSQQPMTNQFKDKERFKKVEIHCGDLTWEDGQMDISANSIYSGFFSV